MKILSIGNSFSQDAQSWLHQIAAADGVDLTCVNLYIGGCYLERHAKNAAQDVCAYDWQENGQKNAFHISIRRALQRDHWDIVTLQQATSRFGGGVETWEPYFTEIRNYVNQYAPQAEAVLHETWAYEYDNTMKSFAPYDFDQKKMAAAIHDIYAHFAAETGFRVLPVGDVIQRVRDTLPEFDYTHGGMSLHRDGFHLSLDYGRWIAGLVWYAKLTGADVTKSRFLPPDCDAELCRKIRSVVAKELLSNCL